MEPLPISTMDIRVYDKEESPLHQIVKKLIWRKISDLEPYNFNHVSTYNNPVLAQVMYGRFRENSKKCQEIRETMTWDHPCIPEVINLIKEKEDYTDRPPYDPDPFHYASRRATNFIPLHSYQDRVFMERGIEVNGAKTIPDITLMNTNGQPETVIEIIYTGKPG